MALQWTTLASLTAHNTSANPAYNKANFPANFTGQSMISQSGTMEAIDSTKSDDSFNPVTPCHVSNLSVHTLFPNYKGKIISLCVPYNFGGNHVDVGINNLTEAQAEAAMLNEQMIGADGITIDWYGPNRVEDTISLLWKAQIESMQNFTFALMIDTSGGSYSTTAELIACLAYAKATYFGSKAYRTFNGLPILYLWGSPVPGVNYPQALATVGPMYVIGQGPSALAWAYCNAGFDWVQPYINGVVAVDSYNLEAKQSFINNYKGAAKGCVLALSSRFNGTLTKTKAWSEGKMLPGNYGACWLSQSALINANLLPNLVEIMLATGCAGDWEEGTQLAGGIDNGITVNTSLKGTVLSWSVSGGTGDESTISEYLILAQMVGQVPNDTAILATQPVGGVARSLDLSGVTGLPPGNYQVYVYAVGMPCVRNQISAPVPYTIASQSMTGTFTGTFVGTFTPAGT
jgi:hypothetical protein